MMLSCMSYMDILDAAAKLLQSCLTLCDPIDGSPAGSPIPGILQARTLEWVAIAFSGISVLPNNNGLPSLADDQNTGGSPAFTFFPHRTIFNTFIKYFLCIHTTDTFCLLSCVRTFVDPKQNRRHIPGLRQGHNFEVSSTNKQIIVA